jgi:CBS domain-containing protein
MSLSRFTRLVATTDSSETVERAATLMRDRGVGCLLVTDKNKPLGIVTDRDLVVRVLAEGVAGTSPVGDFTTYGPLTLNIHDSEETASTMMKSHGVRRIPILDDYGRPVGIVTADDLLMTIGRTLANVCESIQGRTEARELP